MRSPARLPRRHDLRARQAEQDQRSIDHGGRPGDGVGEGRVADRHVEKGAMGLDVLQSHTQRRGNGRERPNLVCHEILDVRGRELKLTPAEPFRIGKSRVGADGHAVLARELHRRPHHSGVARVKPAGNVR